MTLAPRRFQGPVWSTTAVTLADDIVRLPRMNLTLQPLIQLPDRLDLEIYQGDDVLFLVGVLDDLDEPVDLSDAEPTSQIRERFADESPTVLADLDCEVVDEDPWNLILVHLKNEDTIALPLRAVWDLQLLWANAIIRTILAGIVNTARDVTRP